MDTDYSRGAAARRTKWLADGKYGVMLHFLGSYSQSDESWDARVNAFDCEELARQLHEVGAGWLQITISQTGGRFCMPIKSYSDAISSIGEKKKLCSDRDLVAELGIALGKYGIKLALYAAYEGSTVPELRGAIDFVGKNGVGKAFAEDDTDRDSRNGCIGCNGDNSGGRALYMSMLRELSLRYGDMISGWWIDGCYGYDDFARPETPGAKQLVDALRAGNPDVAVALNSGISMKRESAYQDYTTGEENELEFLPDENCSGFTDDGLRWHAMTYLGPWWCEAGCARSTRAVAAYIQTCNDRGGAVTLDVAYGGDGLIYPAHLSVLAGVNAVVHGGVSPDTLADEPEYLTGIASRFRSDILPAGLTDAALGKPVAASVKSLPGISPSSVTDGNPDSYWYPAQMNEVCALDIDLGKPVEIRAARVKARGANNMERRNFELTASASGDFTDAVSLIKQGSFPAPPGTVWTRVLTAPVNARYIRLTGGGGATFIIIGEIEIFTE